MATILVTGITGTIMPEVCARLLQDGHTVVALIRAKRDETATQRLRHIFPDCPERLFALAGDIQDPFAGVSEEDQRHWHSKIDKVLHGAANTKFVETPDNQVFNANVYGTQHMLDLANAMGIPEFHHISTAYVAGWAEEFGEEDYPKQNLRNAYESSKALAEERVRRFSGRTSIYRIPIIVGDSQTGEISSFAGYYGFLNTFWHLKLSLARKWQENKKVCLDNGIFFDEEGHLHIPLSIPCSQNGPINLIPSDWLAEMLEELVQQRAGEETFHLTHPNPRSVRETMIASLEYLGFREVACGEKPNEQHNGLVGRIQRGILTSIVPYMHCIVKDREVFRNERAVRALGPKWKLPPDMGPEVIERLLKYATERNFGRS